MRRKLRLVSGLPTEELVRRVHFHARQGEISHRALGFYLSARFHKSG